MSTPTVTGASGRSFRFEYSPGVLKFGTDSVANLSTELDRLGFDRALVVCGATVGSTPAVIDPVTAGLGEKCVGVFAETTPQKRLETAYEGLEALNAYEADVLVGLGGGSSLDVAKLIALLAGDDRDPTTVGEELAETGTIAARSADDITPLVAIPTTLAGADLSIGAGVTASPESGLVEEPADGGISDPHLMPRAVVYDPALVATTPKSILAASAMNGFDKGIETIYASTATPVTDGTAVRGLKLLTDGLRRLGETNVDDTDGNESGLPEAVLEPVVEGTMLVQYGISRPSESTLSIIHAFGHGLTRTYDVQQGAAHGIIAPHVLRYLFENVDGRRELLANGLGVDTESDLSEAIVDRVTEVRDALGLPTHLRAVDGPEPSEFPRVAREILDDSFMENAPPGLDPTPDELESVLRETY